MKGLMHPQRSSQEIPKERKLGSAGVVETLRVLLVHHLRLRKTVKKEIGHLITCQIHLSYHVASRLLHSLSTYPCFW